MGRTNRRLALACTALLGLGGGGCPDQTSSSEARGAGIYGASVVYDATTLGTVAVEIDDVIPRNCCGRCFKQGTACPDDGSPDQWSCSDLEWLEKTPTCKEWVPASFTYTNGAHQVEWHYDGVGFRHKGNVSLDPRLPKNGWKVKVDEFKKHQLLAGAKRLSFGSEYGDPTFLREHLTYAIMREFGLPGPRTQFVELHLNGEDRGLFLLTEEIDEVFAQTYLGDGTGSMYDVSRGPMLYWGQRARAYTSELGDYQCDKGPCEVGDEAPLVNLARFVTPLDPDDATSFGAELDAHLDRESLIRILALCTFLVNLDSPVFTANNFYLSIVGGRFHMLLWDADQSFGAFPAHVSVDERVNLPIFRPKLTDDPRPLIDRVLADDDLRQEYVARLQELVERFPPERLERMIREAYATIRVPYLRSPRRIYSQERLAHFAETNPAVTVTDDPELWIDRDGLIEDEPRRYQNPIPGLVPFVYARHESLVRQLAGDTLPPAPFVPFVTARASFRLTRGATSSEAANRVHLLIQAHTDGQGGEPSQTLAVRRWLASDTPWDQTLELPVFSVPSGTTHLTAILAIDLAGDGWLDPGVDPVGLVAFELVPAASGEAVTLAASPALVDVTPNGVWEGPAFFVKKFGAPTGL